MREQLEQYIEQLFDQAGLYIDSELLARHVHNILSIVTDTQCADLECDTLGLAQKAKVPARST